MYDHPLRDDESEKYHYNMNKFSPYHAWVNILIGRFRDSVLEAILGDFLLEGGLQSLIDRNAPALSPLKRLRT